MCFIVLSSLSNNTNTNRAYKGPALIGNGSQRYTQSLTTAVSLTHYPDMNPARVK